MNFANYVDIAAENRPEAVAMTDPEREVTYGELADETDRFAKALGDLGIETGERVALYLPNSVVFLAAYFGAMKHGAIPFPINMRFEGQEVKYVLEDASARAVVTHGQFEDVISEIDAEPVEEMIVAGGEQGHGYMELVRSSAGTTEVHPRKSNELAELVYTSGTTGRPKGVKHTHGNLAANANGLIRYMGWTHRDSTLTVCPCFHVSGLNVTSTPFVVAQAENHLLPQWDPETALEVMEAQEVTHVFLIPTMAIDMLGFDGVDEYDLTALETILVGGSPMPKERINAVEETFDVRLLEGYGMTETTPLAAINRPNQDIYKAGSIGPVAGEVVDVRIEDPSTNEEVETDEKGELLWHGDTVTPGYYNLPEKNEEAFAEREGKRWLRSGDIARMDEDGHLFVEDRIDDMIITGGENVYPREVEDIIYEREGVVEAAVIGTPHERLGEQITAIIVGDEDLSAEDIKETVDGRLAGYKVPRRVEFVEELPKTSTRKIDKVALREQF